jgi:hypothetical protein
MKYSFAFKCWAVLLSISIVYLPCFSQVQDSTALQQGQSASDTAQYPPATQYAPANQTPPPPQIPQPQPTSTIANNTSSKASNFDDYLLGKQTGQAEAKGKPVWILAGLTGTGLCLCIGVAGIGVAFAVPPSPPESALMGKSTSFIQGYTEGYKSKARIKNAGWASLGCAMAAVINVIINLSTGQTLYNIQS